MAPADVPAIPAQEFGTSTCGATRTITCGAITSAVGVYLSIPPVAPADVPALFRPKIMIFTCGALGMFTSGGFAYTRRE